MPTFRCATAGLFLLGGMALAQVAGVTWPERWTLFGTVPFETPAPAPEQLRAVPASLRLGDAEREGREVRFAEDGLNLAAEFGGHRRGDTAYLFGILHAERAAEVLVGAGADWWMAWWVNGEPVYDTLEQGNGPAGVSRESHVFTVRLKPGANVLVARVSAGREGFRLLAGLPAAERVQTLFREQQEQARSKQIRELLARTDERLRGDDRAGARQALAQLFELGEVREPAALALRLFHLDLLERDRLYDEACAEAARLLETDLPPWAAPVILARLGRMRHAQGKRAEATAAYRSLLALPAAHPRTIEQAKTRLAELER